MKILNLFIMNFLYNFYEILKEYFFCKKSIIITFLTILIILIFQLLAQLSNNEFAKIFIFDFFTPLIIYNSMLFILIIISKKNVENFFENFQKLIKKGWWIIFLKMFWNICNIIIMGNDYSPDEKSSLFPFFILMFLWFLILLLASYFFPKIILDNKNKVNINFSNFINYFNKNFGKIFLGILISLLSCGIFLFFSSLFLSYFFKIFYFMFNPIAIKIFIEDFLSISIQVIYAHLLSINAFKTFID